MGAYPTQLRHIFETPEALTLWEQAITYVVGDAQEFTGEDTVRICAAYAQLLGIPVEEQQDFVVTLWDDVMTRLESTGNLLAPKKGDAR